MFMTIYENLNLESKLVVLMDYRNNYLYTMTLIGNLIFFYYQKLIYMNHLWDATMRKYT